jgi:NAD(P)H dehydrogenase (quinone)
MADTKVLIVFHSLYGHLYHMAKAVAEGAKKVKGTDVKIMQVPELLNDEILQKMGAVDARKAFADVPMAKPDDLAKADAIVVGTPTRFGNMSASMRAFWDATGGLWQKNALVGKVGSVFTGSATQHGGQETTIVTTHITMLHQGMVLVGLPYSETRQMTMEEISGGSPYGASTISGGDGSRMPSKNELEMAKTQGMRVAEIAKKLR